MASNAFFKASSELSSARQEMVDAHARQIAFVAEGIIPENLKKSDERSVEIKKSAGQ
jgi:hypothetical protein